MRKPEFSWEGIRHRARRRPDAPGGPWREDPRAEAFELVGTGGTDQLVCGLERQVVSGAVADDPELSLAVRAWLVARGARRIDLRREDFDGPMLASGPVAPADLSSPVEHRAPTRVVTIAPSNAEVVGALGCFDRVVAVEDSSDWPPEVESLERLGPDLAPDLDRVAALEPDLVVASLSVPGMERNVVGLHARGLPTLVLAPRSLGDVLAEIERTGEALHVPGAATALVADMRTQMEGLRGERPTTPVRVYLEWWPRPMFTPGRDCYSNELIELAGGTNVFADRPGSSLEINAEELVAADPEVCFVSWCGVDRDKLDPQRVVKRPGLESLASVRAGRVFAIDERFTGRPGPRMLEAARRMAGPIRRLAAESRR